MNYKKKSLSDAYKIIKKNCPYYETFCDMHFKNSWLLNLPIIVEKLCFQV